MSCGASVMRRAYYAVKAGSWEASKEAIRDNGEISEWAFAGLKEAYDKVASGDVGRLSIVQDILREGTDFRRRIIAPASGVGGVTLSYVFPPCNCLKWWVSSGHLVVCGFWWPVQLECSEKKKLVTEVSAHSHEAKVFKAQAAPQGLCDSLINTETW